MLDHQLTFCTRKVKRSKFNKHNNVFLISVKHYTVIVFVEELQKVHFSNYERFPCIDAAYTDFLNNLMKAVNEQFDREIVELIHASEKFFLKFNKSKLTIMKKLTIKLGIIKFKILLGKSKQNSLKLS